MSDFDGELYLRLAGERMILDSPASQSSGWTSPIVEIAAALVAIDALGVTDAQTIARDYERALAFRGDQRSRGAVFNGAARASGSAKPLDPVRVARCDRTMATSWGSVTARYALLAADTTALAITARPTGQDWQAMQHLSGTTLGDDRGARCQAQFNGGGSLVYRGHLVAQPGLSADTEWIDLGGHRLELVDVSSRYEVFVEQLPESSPASSVAR